MPLFKYQAYNSAGQRIDGVIDSQSVKQAIDVLKQDQQLLVSAITLADDESATSSIFSRKRISARDIEYLTSEISVLLQSGVRFDKAVALLSRAKRNAPEGVILADISEQLKKGSTIADAFAEYPKYFDALYVNLIRIGEETGTLTDIFEGLAAELKFKNDLKQSVIQAITYPVIIFFVCLLSIGFIFNFIVPKMAFLFEGSEDALPLHTQIILTLSDWTVQYQAYVGLVVIGAASLIYAYRDSTELKSNIHALSLKTPWLKDIVLQNERVRFCSSMALLLEAGVAMDTAVRLSAGNASNEDIRRQLTIVSESIRSGSTLNGALKQASFFPELYSALLEIGEESGEVTRIFQDLAERGRNDFTAWINRVTALLEPLLIVTMGLIVGGVVVTMMVSLMSVTEFGS